LGFNFQSIKFSHKQLIVFLAGEEQGPEATSPAMLQNAYATPQPGPFPVGPNYATSRSMSNLHRHAVSPQRNRRRWNVPSGGMNDQSFGKFFFKSNLYFLKF
jgi:hypothetical protein